MCEDSSAQTGIGIGAAIEVHRCRGPGLLEAVYQEALAAEFELHGQAFKRECLLPVQYKGRQLEQNLRLDFLVEDSLIVEIKAVENLLPIHTAQLLTYLRLADKPLGLLLNFNVEIMRKGVRRVANQIASSSSATSAPLR